MRTVVTGKWSSPIERKLIKPGWQDNRVPTFPLKVVRMLPSAFAAGLVLVRCLHQEHHRGTQISAAYQEGCRIKPETSSGHCLCAVSLPFKHLLAWEGENTSPDRIVLGEISSNFVTLSLVFKWIDEARWLLVPGLTALPLSLPGYIIFFKQLQAFFTDLCIIPVSVTSAFCACEWHGASWLLSEMH